MQQRARRAARGLGYLLFGLAVVAVAGAAVFVLWGLIVRGLVL